MVTVIVLGIVVILVVVVVGGYTRNWHWTGYRGKTLWDWQALLFVPVTIALIASLITLYQTIRQNDLENQRAQADRALEEKRAQDEALQSYLDQMTQMVLDGENSLLTSKPDSPVRVAARVRTVTALKRLDGEHNESVITFLKESNLVNFGHLRGTEASVLRLDRTDLNGANLARNNLSGLNLRAAGLRYTDLHDANFAIANLAFADLAHANLKDADLRDADLIFANLDGADLNGANLNGADLSGADLETAKHLTQKQIDQAETGNLATKLPDDLQAPSRWSNTNATVREPLTDPRLKTSMVSLKFLKPDEIGIPEKVGTSGVLIFGVQPGGLADAAGFQSGDIVVAVGSDPVQGAEDLRETLGQYQADREVQFLAWRSYFHGYEQGTLDVRFDE